MLAAPCVARARNTHTEGRIENRSPRMELVISLTSVTCFPFETNATQPRLLTLRFPENCWNDKKYVEPRGRVFEEYADV